MNQTITMPVWVFLLVILIALVSIGMMFLLLTTFMLLEVPLEIKKAFSNLKRKRKMIYVYSNKKELYKLPYNRKNRKRALRDVAQHKNATMKVVKEDVEQNHIE